MRLPTLLAPVLEHPLERKLIALTFWAFDPWLNDCGIQLRRQRRVLSWFNQQVKAPSALTPIAHQACTL